VSGHVISALVAVVKKEKWDFNGRSTCSGNY